MSDVLTATPTNPGRKWSDQWSKEQRQLAGHLVSKAIANGKIIPQPCQACGAKSPVAHHENYNEALKIVWLCVPDHIQRHRELDPLFGKRRGRRKTKTEDTNAVIQYASANTVHRIFDLPRSLLYELEKQGLIESISLRRPGTKRGKRLWQVASIRKYLEAERIKRKRESGVVMEVMEDVCKREDAAKRALLNPP